MAASQGGAVPTSSANQNSSRSGVYLAFRELNLSDLPAHPDIPGDRIDVTHFLKQVLDESGPALNAIFHGNPSSIKVLGVKPSPPANAAVTVRKSQVTFEDLKRAENSSETWVSRESLHIPGEESGTASYAEFEGGLYENHMKWEKEYTEDMFDANMLLEWTGLEDPKNIPKGYSAVEMSLWEAYHKIPVISNRVFDTLVISAKYEDKQQGSFLTVQIPVDTSSFPNDFLDSRSHRQGSRHRKQVDKVGDKVEWVTDCDVVLGKYVSIEYVDGATNPDQILWRMALISDAGGRMPMALQNIALPGKVAQDVGMFTKWMESKREAK